MEPGGPPQAGRPRLSYLWNESGKMPDVPGASCSFGSVGQTRARPAAAKSALIRDGMKSGRNQRWASREEEVNVLGKS